MATKLFTIDNWNVTEGGLEFISGDYNAENGAPILKFRYEKDGKTYYCLTQNINGEDSVPYMIEDFEQKHNVSVDWVVIPSIFAAIEYYDWELDSQSDELEDDGDDDGFFVEEEGYYPGVNDRN